MKSMVYSSKYNLRLLALNMSLWALWTVVAVAAGAIIVAPAILGCTVETK